MKKSVDNAFGIDYLKFIKTETTLEGQTKMNTTNLETLRRRLQNCQTLLDFFRAGYDPKNDVDILRYFSKLDNINYFD